MPPSRRGEPRPYVEPRTSHIAHRMTTYRDAGVDIDAGEETVRRIKPLVRRTFTPGVLRGIGAFGAFFQPDFSAYRQPVLVSSVDGVGTKLKVAVLAGRHDTVGQDLVNHCVNDIAVCGAVPLFFLDYYATGRLDPDVAERVVEGFATACEQNGCALIGGETAEMPGLYSGADYDLAGTIVGVVEREAILDGSRVQVGDVLLGLPSTGLHTNGYSLARKVLFQHLTLSSTPDELGGQTVGEALLAVHRSYLAPIRALVDAGLAHAFVHVTGGGLPGNTARVMPEGCTFEYDYSAWERPGLFRLIERLGGVPEADLRRTFNLGIGLVAVVAAAEADGGAGAVARTWGAEHAHRACDRRLTPVLLCSLSLLRSPTSSARSRRRYGSGGPRTAWTCGRTARATWAPPTFFARSAGRWASPRSSSTSPKAGSRRAWCPACSSATPRRWACGWPAGSSPSSATRFPCSRASRAARASPRRPACCSRSRLAPFSSPFWPSASASASRATWPWAA